MRRTGTDAPTTGGAMTVDETARYLGVSRDTIRQAIHSSGGPGCLPRLAARKLGTRYLVARVDADAWFYSLEEAA